MKHKHYDLIVAWANGATIEYLNSDGYWTLTSSPSWNEYQRYRVKLEPKPDIVEYMRIMRVQRDYRVAPEITNYSTNPKFNYICNLVLTFDGETGELKSAEVIK
jgi:hypothetical protein